jgi:hypothetical protein
MSNNFDGRAKATAESRDICVQAARARARLFAQATTRCLAVCFGNA